MDKKNIICTVCPMGCSITICGSQGTIQSIEGFSCKRGEVYAKNEFLHPVRILTSVVKINNSNSPLIAVRSDKPIAKELILRCMEAIKKVELSPPVKCRDVIIEDILGTGANIIATGTAI